MKKAGSYKGHKCYGIIDCRYCGEMKENVEHMWPCEITGGKVDKEWVEGVYTC